MLKILEFLKLFFYYLISYLWYLALYLIIIPYLVYLIGRNLDLLIFDYFLNRSSIFFYGNLSLLIASAFALLGGGLILWSFYTLYFYSGCFPLALFPFSFFNPKKLSQYGPYSLVRHPMTLGYLILLAALGFYKGSLMTTLWIIPLLGFVFYEYTANREERRLALWFGKEYEQYQKKTPLVFPNFFKSFSKKA